MSYEIGRENIWMIQRIAHLTWPTAYKDILSQPQIYYMLDKMYGTDALEAQFDQGHRFFVDSLESANGFYSISKLDNAIKVQKIYVCPEVQGRGLGKRLMLDIFDHAAQAGVKSVRLNVNRFNKAMHFYQALGFEIIGEEDIDIGQGYLMEDYIMEYRLN